MPIDLNKQLAKTNSTLLDLTVELQDRLELARSCESRAHCPLCSPDSPCTPHRQIELLESDEKNQRIKELEARIKVLETTLAEIESVRAELEAVRAEMPRLLRKAREDAVATLPELEKRHQGHIDYVFRLARRLGVHPDTSLDRVQSMLEDAIRKLAG